MAKLEKLTPEQEAKMIEVRDFWIDYVHSCKHSVIDKTKAKEGVKFIYELAGKKEPVVIYVDSPFGAQLSVMYLKEFIKKINGDLKLTYGDSVGDSVRDSVGDSVRDSVGDSVGASVWASVGDSVGASVWDSVRASVGASVWAFVWASVMDSVRASVRDSVRASVRDSVRASVGDSVWDSVGASVWASVGDSVGASVGASVWDSVRASGIPWNDFCAYGSISDYNWVSFYDFFTEIGVANHEKFNQFKQVLLSGVYDMIQLEGFCIVCSLPKTLLKNETGRLHNTIGPAITWNDGYGLYFINGRAMPEKIFNQTFTKLDFIKEENEDIKAGMYEIIESKGEGSMLTFLGAEEISKGTFIHAGGELEEMTLYRTKEKFAEEEDLNGKSPAPLAWLKMACPSTGQQYLIPSDGSFNTVEEAAKYHRPDGIDVSLPYKWDSRA